jgi:hypothetical protein
MIPVNMPIPTSPLLQLPSADIYKEQGDRVLAK